MIKAVTMCVNVISTLTLTLAILFHNQSSSLIVLRLAPSYSSIASKTAGEHPGPSSTEATVIGRQPNNDAKHTTGLGGTLSVRICYPIVFFMSYKF